MNAFNTLNAVIAESGLWDGDRRKTHAFLLSPDVYSITEVQRQELAALGPAIQDCLLGLSQIAVIAYDRYLNYGGAWLLARRVFSTGVPAIYQELQGMNVRHTPRLLKVDLMLDDEGRFRIAEIDGHNKHGLGYSTLALRFREALYPDANAFPGAVKVLAEEVRRLGAVELKLFYADQERFYLPEFQIAAREFAKHGVECRVVSEMDAERSFLEEGLFLDLPFLYHRKDLYEIVIPAYREGRVQFVISPKPFLGAKGVLALLRNDDGNEQLEAILRSFISRRSLDLVRDHIPRTLLVGRQAARRDVVEERLTQGRWVLKESISSGMKGTIFSDEDGFSAALSTACGSSMNWILQEEVVNQAQNISWFESGNGSCSEVRTAGDWFMRITVHYVNRQLGDAIVTARRGKAVHGAKDCVQIGTIVS